MTATTNVGLLVLVGTTPGRELAVFPQVNSKVCIYKGFTPRSLQTLPPNQRTNKYQHGQCWYSTEPDFLEIKIHRILPLSVLFLSLSNSQRMNP